MMGIRIYRSANESLPWIFLLLLGFIFSPSAAFTQTIEEAELVGELVDRFPPDQYVYFGSGKFSPRTMAFLAALFPESVFNIPALTEDIPFPGVYGTSDRDLSFKAYLPHPSLLGDRRIVFVDFALSSFTLRGKYNLLKSIYNEHFEADPRIILSVFTFSDFNRSLEEDFGHYLEKFENAEPKRDSFLIVNPKRSILDRAYGDRSGIDRSEFGKYDFPYQREFGKRFSSDSYLGLIQRFKKLIEYVATDPSLSRVDRQFKAARCRYQLLSKVTPAP